MESLGFTSSLPTNVLVCLFVCFRILFRVSPCLNFKRTFNVPMEGLKQDGNGFPYIFPHFSYQSAVSFVWFLCTLSGFLGIVMPDKFEAV